MPTDQEKQRSAGILIVDDEISVTKALKHMLASITPDVVVADSGCQAIEKCQLRSFDLVISDLRMPGMNGTELLQLLAHDYPSMRRVILTGYSEIEETLDAINRGRVHRYLTKPFELNALLEAVEEELLIATRERSEITRLRAVIDQLSDPA
ncbi:MAG: response regulator [Pseudomonadales bacterium]|nr:response regulator [Pseudomonadales bacterium]